MLSRSVSIHYKPRLYADVLEKIFRSYRGVNLIDYESLNPQSTQNMHQRVDVVILSIGDHGDPDLEDFPPTPSGTKILAFPAFGNTGYRKLPGMQQWEKIVPFGIRRLLDEVLG